MRYFLSVILVSFICFSLGDEVRAAPEPTHDKIGVIGAANPEVNATSAGQTHPVKLGDALYFADTITTSASGNAQLLFLDKSALTVGPNSSLVIDKFVYDPATRSGSLAVSGTKGVFRFIGGALSKNEPVLLKTPVSTIGIRGGIAMVEIDENGGTSATFVYGHEMTVQNMNGEKQSTTTPGSMINVADGFTPPTPPVQIDPSVLFERIGKLEGTKGTNGGATEVPTSETVKQNLHTSAAEPEAAPAAEPFTDTGAAQEDTSGDDSADKQDSGKDSGTTTGEPSGKGKDEGATGSGDSKGTQPGSTQNDGGTAPAPKDGAQNAPAPQQEGAKPVTGVNTTGTAPAGTATTQPPVVSTQPINPPATATTAPVNAPMPSVITTGTTGAIGTPMLGTNMVDPTQVSCARDGRGFDCTGHNALTGTLYDRRGFDRAGRHQNGTFFDNRGFNLAGMNRNGTPWDDTGKDVNGVLKPIETASSSGTTTSSSSGTTTGSSSGTTTGSSSGTTTGSSSGTTTGSSSGTTTGSSSGTTTGSSSTSSGGTTSSSSSGTTNPPLTVDPISYNNYRPNTDESNHAISNRNASPTQVQAHVVTRAGLQAVHGYQPPTPLCSTCSYVDWGVWQDSLGSDGTTTVYPKTVNPNNLEFIVLGQATPLNALNPSDFPNTDTTPVPFSGKMMGHTSINGATRKLETGTFTSQVDLGHRQFVAFDGSFAGFRFGFTSGDTYNPDTTPNTAYAIGVNDIAYTNPLAVHSLDNGTIVTGSTITPGFFGPNAENIAGGFSVGRTALPNTPNKASGIFIGTR